MQNWYLVSLSSLSCSPACSALQQRLTSLRLDSLALSSDILPHLITGSGCAIRSITLTASHSSLAAPLLCRPPLLCQACCFLPDGCTPSFPHLGIQGLLSSMPSLSSRWEVPLGVCPATPSQKPDFVLASPSHLLWLIGYSTSTARAR